MRPQRLSAMMPTIRTTAIRKKTDVVNTAPLPRQSSPPWTRHQAGKLAFETGGRFPSLHQVGRLPQQDAHELVASLAELIVLPELSVTPLPLAFEVRPVTARGDLELGNLVLKLSDLRLEGVGVLSAQFGVRMSIGR